MDQQLNISEIKSDDLVIAAIASEMAVSDPWLKLGMDKHQCKAAFEGVCKEAYVARVGDAIAGVVIIQICGSFKGYIQTLFVSKAFRSQGIGSQLLGYVEKRILEISPNVFICVSAFNHDARRLYERKGYLQVGILHDFVKAGFDELLLRKTVGPILGYNPEK